MGRGTSRVLQRCRAIVRAVICRTPRRRPVPWPCAGTRRTRIRAAPSTATACKARGGAIRRASSTAAGLRPPAATTAAPAHPMRQRRPSRLDCPRLGPSRAAPARARVGTTARTIPPVSAPPTAAFRPMGTYATQSRPRVQRRRRAPVYRRLSPRAIRAPRRRASRAPTTAPGTSSSTASECDKSPCVRLRAVSRRPRWRAARLRSPRAALVAEEREGRPKGSRGARGAPRSHNRRTAPQNVVVTLESPT